MVTHSSTSRPVQCLCMAERTGCPVLTDLWSYVLSLLAQINNHPKNMTATKRNTLKLVVASTPRDVIVRSTVTYIPFQSIHITRHSLNPDAAICRIHSSLKLKHECKARWKELMVAYSFPMLGCGLESWQLRLDPMPWDLVASFLLQLY